MNRYLHTTIHSSIINRSQKVKTNWISINRWINRQRGNSDTILKNFENTMLNEISWTDNYGMIPLSEVPRVVKFIEKDSRHVITQHWQKRGISSYGLMSTKLLYWTDEKVLWLDSDDDCTILSVYLNSMNYTLKNNKFVMYFYHDKRKKKKVTLVNTLYFLFIILMEHWYSCEHFCFVSEWDQPNIFRYPLQKNILSQSISNREKNQ